MKEERYISITPKGEAFAGWRGLIGCCFSVFGDRVGMAVFDWLYKNT